jgi:hypothetical protein
MIRMMKKVIRDGVFVKSSWKFDRTTRTTTFTYGTRKRPTTFKHGA